MALAIPVGVISVGVFIRDICTYVISMKILCAGILKEMSC